MIKRTTRLKEGDYVVMVYRHLSSLKFKDSLKMACVPCKVVAPYEGMAHSSSIVYIQKPDGAIIPQGRRNLRKAYKRELVQVC